MPQYIGFSTQNAGVPPTRNSVSGIGLGSGGTYNPIYTGKKFVLTDAQLVVTDFINALNIRQGEKVGQPSYGTTLWDFVFEPNTQDVQYRLEAEIRRIASLDKRMSLQYVKAYPKNNGILIEVQTLILPFNQDITLSVFVNSNTNTASIQS